MRTLSRMLAVSILMTASDFSAAFVTVGADQMCDYNTIEAAYNGADNVIRIANDQIYLDDFLITKQVFLFGGFDSCLDAQNNQLGNDNTHWDGAESQTVVKINTNNGFQSIIALDRFLIEDGDGEVGGISVKGRSTLILSNSQVEYNVGVKGGGVLVSGVAAKAVISDSEIRTNTGTDGGGIYCELGAEVTISGATRVAYNEAFFAGNGGGIYATSDCAVTSTASSSFPTSANLQYGVIGNHAGVGGGIYLNEGATMLLQGDTEGAANVLVNVATRGSGFGGGGIYVEGAETSFVAINARIDGNSANDLGSGFVVTNQGQFEMRRLDASCWDNSRCSSLSENFVRFEGGIAAAGYANNGAVVNISQTTIAENSADDQTLFSVNRSAYLRLEGNLIYANTNKNSTVPEGLIGLGGEAANGANVDFFYNTLTNNINQAVFVLEEEAEHRLNIFNSIIFNLGVVMDQKGMTNNIIQADCSVVTETNTITGNVGFLSTADPQFIDAFNNNLAVAEDSVAVDMCDESLFIGANHTDVKGLPRGYDLNSKANLFGPYDAGAHELGSDLIFKAGFE